MPTDGVAVHPTAEPALDPEAYFLPLGYRQHSVPEYFDDVTDDGIVWQPDVYPFAAGVAAAHGCDTVIDLGCGRGGKLAALHAEQPAWTYVGVDIGSNIAWCRDHLGFGEWLEADLETCDALPLPDELLARSVVICSDVLEHLVRPEVAADLIGSMLRRGAPAAVLSTPARELRAGAAHPGPPRNTSHVREWASREFRAFLESRGLAITEQSLTRSDDGGGGGLTTQLVLLGPAAGSAAAPASGTVR
ncbi:class I SAM-dependent methyltransferase [Streptomyces sp. NPDC017936]|uniref:class I SAM-dependent methyltransferase n=1 Tax=Streptomyces sp. NPDC017936 TaxID=3365016 RepID=UPI0037A5BFD5